MRNALLVPGFNDANVYAFVIDKKRKAFKELLGIFIKSLS